MFSRDGTISDLYAVTVHVSLLVTSWISSSAILSNDDVIF